MKFDKTCCGTTCDAKANAKYVAKLEWFVSEVASCHLAAAHDWNGSVDEHLLGELVADLIEDNQDVIKHAQQNNSTNGVS